MLYKTTLGYYGRSFATFVTPPASEDLCLASQKNLLTTLSSRQFQLGTQKQKSSGLEAQTLAAAEISMGDVRAQTMAICSKDDEAAAEEAGGAEQLHHGISDPGKRSAESRGL